MRAIILSAGSVPQEIAALFRCSSVGLIPINGRPLIALQLDLLRRLGATHVKVAVRRKDDRLREYLTQYGRLFEISVEVVPIDADHGPGGTLLHALRPVDVEGGLLVLLGDTLFQGDTDLSLGLGNVVYTSRVAEPQRWCMISADSVGSVSLFADKPAIADPDAEAAVGCYWFGSVTPSTFAAFSDLGAGGRVEISTILEHVRSAHGLVRRSVTGWLDCGNADLLVATRRRMIAARSFNTLEIDEIRGTVRKHSRLSNKFRHEINYYRLLPDDLAIFFPRLLSFETAENEAHIELEYYAYPTLSEVYVYEEYGDQFWTTVIQRLGALLLAFSRRRIKISPESCGNFYSAKLLNRLSEARLQSSDLARLFDMPSLRLNGKLVRGVDRLIGDLTLALSDLSQRVEGAVVHGDLCFANILLEPLNKTIRLVDPRGSFHEVGIFGDSRYDAAKLWHSVDGHYDAIINDMFNVKIAGDTVEFDCFQPKIRGNVLRQLETIIPVSSTRREIRLIEGSLFLSMLPLHADHPRRQLAMLMSGLTILNEEL